MNALSREIRQGEVVLLKKEVMKPEYRGAVHRTFFCFGQGFGMSDYTSGSAVFGVYIADLEVARIEGPNISRQETELFQETGSRWAEALRPLAWCAYRRKDLTRLEFHRSDGWYWMYHDDEGWCFYNDDGDVYDSWEEELPLGILLDEADLMEVVMPDDWFEEYMSEVHR